MTTFRADSIYTKPMDQVGPPVAGTWLKGTTIVDVNGQHWNCVASGTPGTWVGGDTATSPANTLYVAANGRLAADGGTGAFENPFLTIQGAIDAAVAAAVALGGGFAGDGLKCGDGVLGGDHRDFDTSG